MPDTVSAPEDPFELAFVMAGAVSAGAYTAGVMDFLFEAFDAWAEAQGEKDGTLTVPPLDVQVKAMCGASAGGINGAIAAAAANLAFDPVRMGEERRTGRRNPFYKTWVEAIGISPLLSVSDLNADQTVVSLLNCSVLDDISKEIVDFGPAYSLSSVSDTEPRRRAWLADPFQLDLTVTNLQGVPFGIQFEGREGQYHEMILHKDHLSFLVPVVKPIDAAAHRDAVIELSPARASGDKDWSALARASLASGAFPVALKPRRIDRPLNDYFHRFGLSASNDERSVVKLWPNPEVRPVNNSYPFVAVDGGAMNNEPFNLAELALGPGTAEEVKVIETVGAEFADEELAPADQEIIAQNRPRMWANHAIVMIDPFTDPRGEAPPLTDTMAVVSHQLIRAMMSQCRFQISDLGRAASNSDYTRYMIAPARGDLRGDMALASAGFSGFLGFFARSFRNHDFFLGRRNCQSFFKSYFVLPKDHPLIIERLSGKHAAFWKKTESQARPGHYPVVPLIGALEGALPMPAWPDRRDYWENRSAIAHSVGLRVDRVMKLFKSDLSNGFGGGVFGWIAKRAVGLYLWPVKKLSQGALAKSIMARVDAEVQALREREGEANAWGMSRSSAAESAPALIEARTPARTNGSASKKAPAKPRTAAKNPAKAAEKAKSPTAEA